ncbi:MAG: sodium/proline symporter PutP [Treponema sp.]|jgi:sodium/proline symporter|nr:sodium/proline symporter PutP [Treponema sp.]
MVRTVETVIVFLCYFAVMIAIGARFFKKTDSLSDYFIGGRRLNAWVAALSAYASDMSGWLMLGFVGTVYLFGAVQVWIAVGLVLGTILTWSLVAKRLRRYTQTSEYSITIPEYLENRFKDESHTLRFVSAVFIAFFFVRYTTAGFVACGTLFSRVFNIDYQIALLISALVILVYTFLGGFRAVCWTDVVQSLLMLAALVTVPIITLNFTGGAVLSDIRPPGFFDIFRDGAGSPISAVSVVSGLAWGLGYFGMPHILIRFMAVKREKEMPKAAVIAGLAVVLSVGGAVFTGLVSARLIPETPETETVFVQVIQLIFSENNVFMPLLGALFLCGILAAIMSTTDSQLLMAASAVTSDLYQGMIQRRAPDKHFLRISRFTVAIICIIAYIIAANSASTIMSIVSSAWSGFGSVFGAVILLSLHWKRLNRPGAAAGLLAGGLTVLLWDYITCVPGKDGWITIGEATGLYSLAPGFCTSLAFIVAVSLLTKPPSPAICEEFERAAVKPIFEE